MLAAEDGENEQQESPPEGEGEEVELDFDGESDQEATEDTDSDEVAEEAPQQSQTFRVKVDGEEVEVPLDELL